MTASSPESDGLTGKLRENIGALEHRRHQETERASWSERLSDRITAFAGSMGFVLLHLILFGAWIGINIGALPLIRPFDPSLVILAMAASVEAIFLSTFVLISQNRMMASAKRQADLDLHISLLTEHELTRLARLVEGIAARMEVPVDGNDFDEVKRDIEPTRVIEAIEEAELREAAAKP